MNKNFFSKDIILIGLLLLPATLAGAQATPSASATTQTLHLKDGSVIRGRLTAVEGDSYVIQTENIGAVKVRIADLLSLSTGNQSLPAGTSTEGSSPMPVGNKIPAAQVEQLKNQLLADPEITNLLQQLINDPSVKTLLTDPALMTDILSMDPQRIQGNPKIEQLMNNPALQKIMERLQAKNQGR